MGKVIGIDLGTTNTVLAYLDESGDPKIQVNAAGENLTPSAVHIDEQKNVLVGTEAIKQAEFGFRIWTDYKRVTFFVSNIVHTFSFDDNCSLLNIP